MNIDWIRVTSSAEVSSYVSNPKQIWLGGHAYPNGVARVALVERQDESWVYIFLTYQHLVSGGNMAGWPTMIDAANAIVGLELGQTALLRQEFAAQLKEDLQVSDSWPYDSGAI